MVCTVWGAGFALMKIGLRYLPPFLYVGTRFVITAGCIAVYMRGFRVEWRVPRALFAMIVILSVLFFLQQGLIFLGLTYTGAGRMGVILNTQPIITAVAAHWFVEQDRLTWNRVAGLVMALLGVFVVFRESFTAFSGAALVGDSMALGAAILWGTQVIVTKRLGRALAPSTIIFWQSLLACFLFFGVSALTESGPIPRKPLDLAFWGVTAYIVLVSTVFGFVAWVHLIQHNVASRVVSFCFVTPIASVVSAWLILGEPVTGHIVSATCLVGGGIFLANFEWEGAGNRLSRAWRPSPTGED